MTKKMNIPFSPPDISEKEIEAVSRSIKVGHGYNRSKKSRN